jgi:hypothetical protein
MSILGDGNTIKRVHMGDPGLYLYGHDNYVERVNVVSTTKRAIFFSGRRSQLRHARLACTPGAMSPCLTVDGGEHKIHDVVITGGYIGIFVYDKDIGEGNYISKVKSTDAFRFDAVDDNGDCDHNVWKRNTFSTADPPCLLGTAGQAYLDVGLTEDGLE